ncbi:hypothetical protein BC834DRAFT_285651 [Gloeopeniophorella convolvens]|nr:hypothetical protein BC834DRAFT_285651 [Gloeopeniophorella convolvens]
MLASTIVIALLAAQAAPSFAAPLDSHSYVAREGVAGDVAEDAAKAAASSGIGKTIAGSLAGALTSLGVGGAVTGLFSSLGNKDSSSSKRDLELLELIARESVAGEVVDDAAKVAAKSGLGKSIAKGIAGTLTSLGVSSAITDLLDPSSDSSSKRALLDDVESIINDLKNVFPDLRRDGLERRTGIAGLVDDGVVDALKTGAISGAVGGGATALIEGIKGLVDNKSSRSVALSDDDLRLLSLLSRRALADID